MPQSKTIIENGKRGKNEERSGSLRILQGSNGCRRVPIGHVSHGDRWERIHFLLQQLRNSVSEIQEEKVATFMLMCSSAKVYMQPANESLVGNFVWVVGNGSMVFLKKPESKSPMRTERKSTKLSTNTLGSKQATVTAHRIGWSRANRFRKTKK